MNPQRARDLHAKYEALQMLYRVNPTQDTLDEMGRAWRAFRQEVFHQTGRREVRDTTRFGDPARLMEARVR